MKCKKVAEFLCMGFVLFLIGSVSLSQTVWGAKNIKQTKDGKTLYLFKMGTLAQDGVGWADLIKEIVNHGILKVTNGQVNIDWYYGGTIGDGQDILAKMRNEQLQGGGLTGNGLVMTCPEMTLMDLPFMFEDYNEVEYASIKRK
ncbi:MAG: hypothetical protein CVU62_12735 [Deltaproteobacteria bacterium HGW-Deltaproteobacteria-2]|jgi:TRAP-type C4-dicarboxylate transport system substrate-binding protein|nr:MAG: hypothetical protein CVU62_12735 [Deltaproteobacteria bacterium HGW-Deltaproteobacteria-2]